MKLRLMTCWLLILGQCCAYAKNPQANRSTTAVPHTVDEAVTLLKSEWLSEKDRDWILRNPREHVVATLHLPFGTGVRNSFKLWGGNPELLASCGTKHAEECSGVIFEHLWTSVRQDADPAVVRSLDCQFQLIEEIKIDYKGFYALTIGDMLEHIQQQIDKQMTERQSEGHPGCGESLRLQPTGNPDLRCWSRVEFSEDGHGPVSLSRLLGWISWRNGFDVLNFPPEIRLPFRNRCAWPEQPPQFRPPKTKKGQGTNSSELRRSKAFGLERASSNV